MMGSGNVWIMLENGIILIILSERITRRGLYGDSRETGNLREGERERRGTGESVRG